MSETNNSNTTAELGGNDSDTRYSKTVTFVGYTGIGAYVPERQAANRIDDEVDYTEIRESEYVRAVIHCPGWNMKVDPLAVGGLEDKDTGELEVTEFTEVKTRHAKSTRTVCRKAYESIRPELPDSVNGGLEREWSHRPWTAENGARVSIDYGSFDTMGMLKHPSEISADDMWEDEDDEQWVVQVVVEAKEMCAKQKKWVDNSIFEKIPELLAQADGVRRVRYTDCEEQRTKEGVCYNL